MNGNKNALWGRAHSGATNVATTIVTSIAVATTIVTSIALGVVLFLVDTILAWWLS